MWKILKNHNQKAKLLVNSAFVTQKCTTNKRYKNSPLYNVSW